MIRFCPICCNTQLEEIFPRFLGPILPVMERSLGNNMELFAWVRIVSCMNCGHWYNQLFDPELAQRMYSEILTNIPVDPSMFRVLDEVANWIGQETFNNKRVLEIGGGSGDLARTLARGARSVTVYEPSAGLGFGNFTEKNIELIQSDFNEKPGEVWDLIVCRQVLEHLPDPIRLLTSIRNSLSDSGKAYIEVPRADYIAEYLTVFEFHNAHVQYFQEENFKILLANMGFRILKFSQLKNGHDMAFLISNDQRSDNTSYRCGWNHKEILKAFNNKLVSLRSAIDSLSKPIGLYGANWQGASFYNLFDFKGKVNFAFDDNCVYNGKVLKNAHDSVEIVAPPNRSVLESSTIVITAFLHKDVICRKLSELGFNGDVVSLLHL